MGADVDLVLKPNVYCECGGAADKTKQQSSRQPKSCDADCECLNEEICAYDNDGRLKPSASDTLIYECNSRSVCFLVFLVSFSNGP